MPFSTGENVGPYRIVQKLGQGGMATVFKAYHPALDRYVAIKVLHPAFQEDPSFLARFQREARIVAKLDHPNIVPIYDFAEHRAHPYLVMRFIEGETLKGHLQRGPLNLDETRRVMEAVGGALSYAHAENILHRDIKPSNVILTPEGHIYLTDFGLARMAEAGESTLSRDMMVGTPQYISPEQARGETNLDIRTDVYSLGVVLYELLVGRVPFQADTPYAVIHDHIFTPLPLPRSLNPGLPEPLERVLLKTLAKDPDDRFQTIGEMLDAFEAALGPTPAKVLPKTVVAPPPTVAAPVRPAPRKRRWPWVAAVAASLLCLALAVLGLRALRRQSGTILPTSEHPEQILEDARAAREEGEPIPALAYYRQAADADPHLVPAYLEAGDLLTKIGQTERAMSLYREGLEANSDSPELHQRVAELAALTRQWGEAQQQVEWMLQQMPGDPLSHAYAALLALSRGAPCDEARPELDTALHLDPDLPLAHYALALCYLQEADRGAAQAELEFVLAHAPPPLLQLRAELRLSVLELGPRQAIEREFDALGAQASRISGRRLQLAFEDIVEAAREAWEAGDADEAVRALSQVRDWVRERWDDLGGPVAGQLMTQVNRVLFLAVER